MFYKWAMYYCHHLMLLSLPPGSLFCFFLLSYTLLYGCLQYVLSRIRLSFLSPVAFIFFDSVISILSLECKKLFQFGLESMLDNKNMELSYVYTPRYAYFELSVLRSFTMTFCTIVKYRRLISCKRQLQP